MKKITILYIGNNLSKSTQYITTIDSLSTLLEEEGYTVYRSSKRKQKLMRLLDMCFSVIKYKNKVDYILIDTYSTSSFIYAYCVAQLARFFRIKYLPILHGGNLPARLSKNPKMCAHVFENSYRNIAPSEYLKQAFSLKDIESVLIPNSIEIDNYIFKPRKVMAPKLLFVRALAEIYNPTMAINVLDKLKVNFPGAKLCMIGPDKDGSLEKMKHLVLQKNLVDDVEFTGVLSKKEWHKKSENFDIFINTTNIDNTPVSVIEAMALGVPIVSTNVGGLPYLLSHTVDALLVAPNDVAKMTKEIESILNGKHKTMARNARQKVEQFGWGSVKQQWLKILK